MNCFYPEIVGEGMGEASGVPVEIREGYGAVLEELHPSLPSRARPVDQRLAYCPSLPGRAGSLYLGS